MAALNKSKATPPLLFSIIIDYLEYKNVYIFLDFVEQRNIHPLSQELTVFKPCIKNDIVELEEIGKFPRSFVNAYNEADHIQRGIFRAVVVEFTAAIMKYLMGNSKNLPTIVEYQGWYKLKEYHG